MMESMAGDSDLVLRLQEAEQRVRNLTSALDESSRAETEEAIQVALEQARAAHIAVDRELMEARRRP